MTLTLLHTSDWHIGHNLYGRKRYEEHEAFFQWLLQYIEERTVDVLLVSGDIFDSSTPSNRAQSLYYDFLHRLSRSSCSHAVITGGNHDSPTLLDAPAALLSSLSVHVVGRAPEKPEDSVRVLRDAAGDPVLVVCAVPFLRDRDLRRVEEGESMEEKDIRLVEAMKGYYAAACGHGEFLRKTMSPSVPLVGMGHLFVAGGRSENGDGMRELYVGSLARMGSDLFPPYLDYLALGHLHAMQRAGKKDHFRYSGSPLPMSFGEARRSQGVLLVSFNENGLAGIETGEVPRFQELLSLKGDLLFLEKRMETLKKEGSRAWLEVICQGEGLGGGLKEYMDDLMSGSFLDLLRVGYEKSEGGCFLVSDGVEQLSDLDVREVFQRCMDVGEVPEKRRAQMMRLFEDILSEMAIRDGMAE
ncbi:exonuclease subunit SbcD [Desulfobotulus sp. H1]|uniref:Nuclease SbcCD subunit D n=1 Tax=Desulfobotulus pelophilus TaxID=2823377 RepID=A0ABT3NDJ6_9BACT|nr:exonuclease subunit SbcD [Desulfobotulus pelophilus]MCW7755012.1 exonuclease subunit SbcD [Desulfobotulus pelophilus]